MTFRCFEVFLHSDQQNKKSWFGRDRILDDCSTSIFRVVLLSIDVELSLRILAQPLDDASTQRKLNQSFCDF